MNACKMKLYPFNVASTEQGVQVYMTEDEAAELWATLENLCQQLGHDHVLMYRGSSAFHLLTNALKQCLQAQIPGAE